MTGGYWILEGHEPVHVDDVMTWGRWFEKSNRHVANDEIRGVRVSTVFLGLDHSFTDGPPLLFETMIFGGEHDGWQGRCSTWVQAEAMHAKALRLVTDT